MLLTVNAREKKNPIDIGMTHDLTFHAGQWKLCIERLHDIEGYSYFFGNSKNFLYLHSR